MAELEEKTGFKKWLDRMAANIKPTPKGVRLTLTVYVYPDGHGNLMFQHPEIGRLDAENQPVNSCDEATEAFRAVWQQATTYPSRSRQR